MTTWTPAAHDELRRRLDSVRDRLVAANGGAAAAAVDANEVVDDLRRHVDAEFDNDRVNVVTVEDVRRVLTRIGLPQEASPEAAAASAMPAAMLSLYAPHTSAPIVRPARKSSAGTVGIVLFGILTPLAAIVIEATSGTCAQTLFDPFPSAWHVLLALMLPLVNLALLVTPSEFVARHRGRFALLSSFAIGVGIFYSLLFLPISPFALIGIVAFGIGLLPLSPLTGLIAAFTCRRRYLGKADPDRPTKIRVPRLRGGLALAGLALLVLHVPPALTHVGLRWATAGPDEGRASGLWLLRHLGNEEIMLRACYAQSGRFGDPLSEILSFGGQVSPDQAREAYYRATGTPFNALPPPRGTFASRWNGEWDFEQGGDAVAGQVKGLALAESRIDGVVDGDGVWAYAEWTMVFRNDASVQREARAQLLLPAGGVVSRLTLWINGEPCEAAFSGRDQVKRAYKSVVTQRRDPVLVTTAGPDRVMMQCFPVPPRGGNMKIRVGVTFPLQLARADHATFGLPAIVERNFAIKPSLAHSVWLEASGPLGDATGLLKAENPKPNLFAVRGQLTDAQLAALPATLSAVRDPQVRTAWATAPAQVKEAGGVVVQQIDATPLRPPGRVVVVVDTSRTMAAAVGDVAAALAAVPAGTSLSVILADDVPVELTRAPVAVTGESIKAVAEQLANAPCRGGPDSAPALCRAWDLASEAPDGLILWVHGPQPVALGGVEALHQRYERRPDGPRLLMLQAAPGPNRVCEALDLQGDIARLDRRGTTADDLRRLFFSWSQGQPALRVSRQLAATRPTTPGAKQTAPHLARLWAFEEVRRAAHSGKATPGSASAKEVVRLASAYQLVTPLSGAVVLETQAQYAANGLTPVDPATVPTVPEPETVFLIVIAAVAILWAVHRRRRAWRLA